MLTLLEWHQQGGTPIELNTLIYPVHHFFVEPIMSSNTPKKKRQRPGSWPTFNFPTGMSIDVEGAILGTDTANYIANREVWMDRIYVPDDVQTIRRHGFLRVQYDGWGSYGDVDCHVTQASAPLSTDYGWSVSEFRINFFAFELTLTNGKRL